MHLSPDQITIAEYYGFRLNATLLFTWVVMLFLIVGAKLIGRRVAVDLRTSRWQNIAEIIVLAIRKQIQEMGLPDADRYIAFLGTLFLFIATSNFLTILPRYEPPTASLSTTAALAVCVFFAVPWFAITRIGALKYLKTFIEPTFVMLPFNIIGEVSRTLALAVRLFGNMMSGSMILAILLSVTPLLFPAAIIALGLLTGTVQAYIFTILAAVYLASAIGGHSSPHRKTDQEKA